MAALLFRLVLFVALFMGSGALLKSLLPGSWGNPWWSEKSASAYAGDPSVTVHFVGSSRTYRHLAPVVFDSVMAAHGHSLRSFNWGSPALFPPEEYLLLEHAVRQGDIPGGSTVFVEVTEPKPVEAHLRRSARSSYFMSPRTWWRLVRFAQQTQEADGRQDFIAGHTRALLNNLFHISQFKGIVKRWPKVVREPGGMDVAGFLSFDRHLALKADGGEHAMIRDARDELLRDTLLLARQREQLVKVRAATPGAVAEGWWSMAGSMLETCSAHGVEVFWFLPPKTISPAEHAFFHALPANRRIDLNDPLAHPEFYTFAYRFDRGHLNARGARLHTQRLAVRYHRTTHPSP